MTRRVHNKGGASGCHFFWRSDVSPRRDCQKRFPPDIRKKKSNRGPPEAGSKAAKGTTNTAKSAARNRKWDGEAIERQIWFYGRCLQGPLHVCKQQIDELTTATITACTGGAVFCTTASKAGLLSCFTSDQPSIEGSDSTRTRRRRTCE